MAVHVAASSTVMDWLEAQTHELVGRVADELDLLGNQVSWLDYRLYLFRMYGFHVAVERALGACSAMSRVLGDSELRNNKVALLAHDLVALGVERRDLQRLPRMSVPALREVAEALGWMYVVERQTLAAREILGHLAKRIPTEMEIACAYLGCYGAEVQTRWRELGAAIEAYATTPALANAIATAANDCLLRLHRWVRPSSRESAARIEPAVVD